MSQLDLKQAVTHLVREAVRAYLNNATYAGPIPVEHPLESRGDYASAVAFSLAKQAGKDPASIAHDLAMQIGTIAPKVHLDACGFKGSADVMIATVESVGPFINLTLSKTFLAGLINHINQRAELFGTRPAQDPKTIVIEYSGVNIGKPFSIGHLRSTINGAVIADLLSAVGHKVIRLNYLGDWGTQFGKLIAGYKKWGTPEGLAGDPVGELVRVYVKFHQELAKDDALSEEGREWFRKLEQGDQEATNLWQLFVDASLAHAKKIYDLLGVTFDKLDEGEAQYRDKMSEVLDLLQQKGLLKKSQGATIVDLEAEGLPALLVKKTDEASLYATRELAAAIERYKRYKFDAMLYEVGAEQELHFRQVFTVLKKMGFEWADKLEHLKHGLYRMDGRKMRTRAGTTVDMLSILEEATARAQKVIAEKNPELANRAAVARQVGVGAVKYNDLSQNREHSIDFDFDRMLSFEGNSAPYLQYTQARIRSILRKAGDTIKPDKIAAPPDAALPAPEEQLLARRLVRYPEVVLEAANRRMPHLLATELYELAGRFNVFYGNVPVLKAPKNERLTRLALCAATAQVLRNGLGLLGIQAPQEM
ncbi:MAG: arginine--tRNA ligase [bacterium]|nr:arginine--tRNA ligase [bacterium]